MIRFDGLCKFYGALEAARRLTLELVAREYYALLGPNGAGKTMALRCLATLLHPTAGTGSVGGADVLVQPLEVRRRPGFLATSTGLYEGLTAREPMEYLGRLCGRGWREAASGPALREGMGHERGATGSAARGAAVSGEAGVALAPRMPRPGHVLPFVALLAALYFYGGVALQLRFGEGGLLLAEWTLLFVPAALFVLVGGFEPRRVLSLSRPSARQLGGALLLVLGGAPVAWLLAWLQTFVLPVPFEWLEALERFLSARDLARLVWLLLVVALTPAVCEEVVFRGVLLSGTRGAMSLRSAVLLNAVVFGAFHLSYETAIRFLPTAWVGLLLAWAVARTGSIWTSVLMHFVNNGLVVLIASVPALSSWLGTGALAPPWYLLPAGILLLGVGVQFLGAQSAGGRGPESSSGIEA